MSAKWDDDREDLIVPRRGIPPLLAVVGSAIILMLGVSLGGAVGYLVGHREVATLRADLAEAQGPPAARPVGQPNQNDNAAAGRVQQPVAGKPKRPTGQAAFKAAVLGNTRTSVVALFGSPEEIDEDAQFGGWDGPAAIYHGPFADEMGFKKAKAIIHYRPTPNGAVAQLVQFTD